MRKRKRSINRRTRRSRSRYKKNRGRTGYLVMILSCLLILNIGFLLYRVMKNNLEARSINSKKIDIALEKSLDDQGELEYENDFIIDRLDEYENLIFIKESNGISSIENIPEPLNIEKVKVDKEKPYILMYHTHATESFLAEDKTLYYNEDTSKNMINIGEVMTKVLEAKGHKVDHVTIKHDRPSFNQSYTRSKNTINKKKNENDNLKIFLDLHRDGVADNSNYKEKFLKTGRIDINGTSAATFSLVVGPDASNYEQILNFAKYVKAVSDTLYPGLCKGIIVKPYGKYNLEASNYAALVEVGSNLVTQEEAIETAKLVGEILSLVIDSVIE